MGGISQRHAATVVTSASTLLLILFCFMRGVGARSVEDLRVMRPVSFHQGNSRQQGEVSIISKDTWLAQGIKPMPAAYHRKKNRKVDTQKFRRCIFFQLCAKSECFHYGRYNTCS